MAVRKDDGSAETRAMQSEGLGSGRYGRMTGWFGAGVVALLFVVVTVGRAQGSVDGAGAPAAPIERQAPLTAPGEGTAAAADPPLRAARLSLLQGNVSTEPASVNTFSPAELNQVLTSGDRVYTDEGAAAELQAGQTAVRLGGGTDLTVSAMTDQLAQFGLASGSIHVRSYAIPAGTVLELDSPEAAVTILQPGDVRVDEDGASHATTVTVVSGQVQVDGPGVSQQLNGGDRVRIHAENPETQQGAYAEPVSQATEDALDTLSEGRDGVYSSGIEAESGYLNPDTTGSADLASYGSWDTGLSYGPVWFPVVAAGWRPYCDGHWQWVAPWGWTWVGSEPWGFAPFHYGRWAFVNGRWGWVPGTPILRPVYAPALVTFVGGRQFSASLGYGAGTGVAAWFPLAPGEAYAPWYHGSTSYVNRVNASNLYNPNVAEAKAFYNQRAVNVFGGSVAGAVRTGGYANRAAGTVAMSQASFASGQSAIRHPLLISASALAQAPVLAHPAVSPDPRMILTGPARAVPPQTAHPAFPSAGEGVAAGESSGTAAFANRPAFVHAQTPPGPRPSFEEQRQAMERTEPGRPLPLPSATEAESLHRPVGGAGVREGVPRPGGAAATPARSAPARSSGEAAKPAASGPPAGSPRK